MSPDEIVDRIRRNLSYVYREAEALRPAELTRDSPEFKAAVVHLDALISRQKVLGTLQLTIGRIAMRGQLAKAEVVVAMPGEAYELVEKRLCPVEVFGHEPATQPYYGDGTYFDLVTIGQILSDGGVIELVKPDSSWNT